MREAYGAAHAAIGSAAARGGNILDCGAGSGGTFDTLQSVSAIQADRYFGIEWDGAAAAHGRARGLSIEEGDLNRTLNHDDGAFGCVFGLSALEHLLNPCRYLTEAHRVLAPGGTLVLLTPNISTYFTAVQILLGQMPSSGPHPDSDRLKEVTEPFRVRSASLHTDTEGDHPVHRHLVVFSYRVLEKYLRMLGFREVHGRGFGLYPFPNFIQPLAERLDPWHCHQMVFTAHK